MSDKVLTHKKLDKKQYAPIIPKADNPNRLGMSKKDVLAMREKELERARLMAEAQVKIDAELGLNKPEEPKEEPAGETVPPVNDNPKIAELQKRMAQQTGPGSAARRQRIKNQIDELRAAEA